jgi:prepilin-type N-terminal cleavage/methylation domain-containing protein
MVRQQSHSWVMVRRGFTLVELLVSMALIIFIMSIVSDAFVDGLESLGNLKGVGDLQQRVQSAAVELRAEVVVANESAESFIEETLESGTVDASAAQGLQGKYRQIVADSADLAIDLQELEDEVVDPADKRRILATLEILQQLKAAAEQMDLILSLLAPDGTKP